MSLRDELIPVRAGYKSAIDEWFNEKDDKFREEFTELIHDHSVGHTQLHTLAKGYGLPVKTNAFTDWRKNKWASKTS